MANNILDYVNEVSPIDPNREDNLLVKNLRETFYNPPKYVPREEPSYETCERVLIRGMYRGQKCFGKREVQSASGKWFCRACMNLKGKD